MEKEQVIKGLKLAFSRVGVTTENQPRRIMWMVSMKIWYEDGSRCQVPLMGHFFVTTAEKKKIKVYATTTGFVVATPDEPLIYHFYNAAGELTGEQAEAEVGKLEHIVEQAVIFRNGNRVRLYSIDSKLIAERIISAEKVAELDSKE